MFFITCLWNASQVFMSCVLVEFNTTKLELLFKIMYIVFWCEVRSNDLPVVQNC